MLEQLPLTLPVRAASGREDFIVAPCNARVVDRIDTWPKWADPVQYIYGPAGCGKSHLASVWMRRHGAQLLDESVARGFRLHLADGLLQPQLLGGDFRRRERRIVGLELSDDGLARTLVDLAPGCSGVLWKRCDGFFQNRVVICHIATRDRRTQDRTRARSTVLRLNPETDSGQGLCHPARARSRATRPVPR